MKPYVYYIICQNTGDKYIGSKYGKKTADPTLFWINYFTSSKLVHQLIKIHGLASFNFSIRKTFDSAKECIEYETKLLKRLNAAKRGDFLNKHNNDWSQIDRKKVNKARRAAPRRRWITDGLNDQMVLLDDIIPNGWKIGRSNGKSSGKRSPEFCEKMKKIIKARTPPSLETKALWSKQRKGKKHGPMSELHKQSLRKPKTSTKNMQGPKKIETCPHCKTTGGVNVMRRWHFNNCKEINK